MFILKLLFSEKLFAHLVNLDVSLRLLEDAYVVKDPFTREGGFMVIGSHCSLCHSEVCCNQVLLYFLKWNFRQDLLVLL